VGQARRSRDGDGGPSPPFRSAFGIQDGHVSGRGNQSGSGNPSFIAIVSFARSVRVAGKSGPYGGHRERKRADSRAAPKVEIHCREEGAAAAAAGVGRNSRSGLRRLAAIDERRAMAGIARA